jgi:hypothetical protein
MLAFVHNLGQRLLLEALEDELEASTNEQRTQDRDVEELSKPNDSTTIPDSLGPRLYLTLLGATRSEGHCLWKFFLIAVQAFHKLGLKLAQRNRLEGNCIAAAVQLLPHVVSYAFCVLIS